MFLFPEEYSQISGNEHMSYQSSRREIDRTKQTTAQSLFSRTSPKFLSVLFINSFMNTFQKTTSCVPSSLVLDKKTLVSVSWYTLFTLFMRLLRMARKSVHIFRHFQSIWQSMAWRSIIQIETDWNWGPFTELVPDIPCWSAPESNYQRPGVNMVTNNGGSPSRFNPWSSAILNFYQWPPARHWEQCWSLCRWRLPSWYHRQPYLHI